MSSSLNDALRAAIRERNHDEVLRVLESGAAVNHVDDTGLTALHHAVLHLNPVAMVLLRQHGACPLIPGPDGSLCTSWLDSAKESALDDGQYDKWHRSTMAWALWCHPTRATPDMTKPYD